MKKPVKHDIEVEIDSIGARGDGLAKAGDARLYVPFTVPGDKALVRLGEQLGDGYEIGRAHV